METIDITGAGEDNSLKEKNTDENIRTLDNHPAATTSDITTSGSGSSSSILHTLVENIRNYKHMETVVKNWAPRKYMEILHLVFPNAKRFTSADELIISSCMKYIILKYKFYSLEEFTESVIYDDLVAHIKRNITYVLTVIKKASKNRVSKTQILIQCPYKQLKSIFYDEVQDPKQSMINWSIPNTNVIPDITRLSAGDILHFPHVAVTIVFPNFEASRQNLHRSDLKLINYKENYRPSFAYQNISLRYKPFLGRKDSFYSKFISSYITQLRMMIQNSPDITSSKKVDMLSILAAFMTDFNLCTDGIDVETEYYAPLIAVPYVRYLAQKRADTDLVEYDIQDLVNEKISVRLQEQIHPIIMFKLKKFRVPYELQNNPDFPLLFQMDKKYLSKNQWLIFTCTLCDVQYKGFLATYEMVLHLFSEHGVESDWTCANCGESFSTITLSSQRWHHTCKVYSME